MNYVNYLEKIIFIKPLIKLFKRKLIFILIYVLYETTLKNITCY